MKLILLTMSSLLSISFTQMNHPLAMGLVLLIQTVMISMITGLTTQSFWFSYILFLIFIGGMLVLFIYVTSLASNEMFILSTKLMCFLMFITPLMVLLMKVNHPIMMNQESWMFLTVNNLIPLPLLKLYNYPTGFMTIMMVTYLLITLIAVVNITNIFKGPLRQMN
uniref:NADH-ubiquinone oxidoreductase chain 6 n=1 Tax=Panesthia sp. Salganea TaxID=2093476 RepID=A0A2P1H9Q9_9NEOP|nr:NADH dehydrogenase subunit 6 [Panesthia guizhouensis]AVN68265.1 NADH dehydrogenase subunit 6 [Panesthia sp. Salganea]WGO57441.1 NADH dehydrogenase subunit 6 [Panesthia guizhouensis]